MTIRSLTPLDERFERDWRAHSHQLRKVASRHVPPGDVDDVLQNGRIRCWKDFPAFEATGLTFGRWATRRVKLAGFEWLRSKASNRRTAVGTTSYDAFDTQDGRWAADPKQFTAEDLIADVVSQDILDALAKLRPSQRLAITLAANDAAEPHAPTLKKIGRALGVSRTTAHRTVREARLELVCSLSHRLPL